MTPTPTRTLLALTIGWGLVIAGCGSDRARPFGGDGTGGDRGGKGGTSTDNDGGSGGASGSGGIAGDGGVVGSGGGTGSGGRPGTGGVLGTGGVIGSGGTGSGGTGSGGRSGTGGAGGANPATCNAIANEYANEIQNAKVCTIASTVPQCQTPVPSTLVCAYPCTTYVQSPANLHQIMNNWQAAGCIAALCPGLCIAAQPGNCALGAAATVAMCQNGLPTAP